MDAVIGIIAAANVGLEAAVIIVVDDGDAVGSLGGSGWSILFDVGLIINPINIVIDDVVAVGMIGVDAVVVGVVVGSAVFGVGSAVGALLDDHNWSWACYRWSEWSPFILSSFSPFFHFSIVWFI